MKPEPTVISLITIHPNDNVGILPCKVPENAVAHIGDRPHPLAPNLGLGHKIAVRPIARGEQVIKYGVSIGSATEDIPTGAHIHLQNMKSDIIPTYTHAEGERFTQ